MAFKSAGVYAEEYAQRYAQRTPSAIRAVFAGDFQKGPVGTALAITSHDELVTHFGLPTDKNYNDFAQVYRFLHYYSGIYVTRIADFSKKFETVGQFPTDVSVTPDNKITTFDISATNPYSLPASTVKKLKQTFKQYDRFTIAGDNADNEVAYTLLDVETFSFIPALQFDIFKGSDIQKLSATMTASVEMPTERQWESQNSSDDVGNPAGQFFVESPESFEIFSETFPANNEKSAISFFARSAGSWGNSLQIAIAKPEDFTINYSAQDVRTAKLAFPGVVVDTAFRRAPAQGQIGVLVALNGRVQEQFIGTAENIASIINTQSNYVFAKRGIGEIWSTAYQQGDIKKPLRLLGGADSEISVDDVRKAYQIFEDKDTFLFDVIIANELDSGLSAVNLARKRGDITAVVGANYNLFNSKNPAEITDNLVDWREHLYVIDGSACCQPQSEIINAQVLKFDNAAYVGNYGAWVDPFNNKTRLINLAGDIAGLRCLTNDKHGEWKASAGVNRGVLAHGIRLIWNPTQAHRDILYTHNINPVVAMQGVGNVLWGQRTMANLEDPFISWHVRSMTNMIVRNSSLILRQFVMENISQFTMQSVISSLQPLMNSIKAGGGLQEFYIRCDFNNNSPETMANNELIVDIFIKPTGIAEYIRLRVVNTGSESVAEVISREQINFR